MDESTELIISIFEGEERAVEVLDELKKREDTKSIDWKNSAVHHALDNEISHTIADEE